MSGKGIAFRLIIILGITTSLVFAILFLCQYLFMRSFMEQEVEKDARTLVTAVSYQIESVLAPVQKVPDTISSVLAFRTLSETELVELLKDTVRGNPSIFGSAIAFEPYAFLPSRKYFAPYVYRQDNNVVLTWLDGTSYRYAAFDWYQIPRELGKAVWSEPYYDEGAGNIVMTTYSAPFFKSRAGNREIAGIATADISLEWLSEMIGKLTILKSGYGALISKNGTVVAHPQRELIMNETIFSIAEAHDSAELREMGRRMIRGEEGLVSMHDKTGRDFWVYFAPVPSNGWSLLLFFPKDELTAGVRFLSVLMLGLGSFGVVLLCGTIILVSRSITNPLRKMTKTAASIGAGNFDIELPMVRSQDEVSQLADSFRAMQTALKTYTSQLRETTALKERIESELRIAHDIQMGILPKLFPPFPNRSEVEVYAILEPAKEVGGDFYDFFFVDDRHFCFIIGDVSDKGIPASLFMAVTKTLLKATALEGVDAARILEKVNQELARDNERSMFVTVFCAILDTQTGEVVAANGGHPRPILLRRQDPPELLNAPPGLVVAALEETTYQLTRFVLRPGDVLFLYTDGVTEATSAQGELFSVSRLYTSLGGKHEASLPSLIDDVMEDVRFFAKDAPQFDDITMLTLRYQGTTPPVRGTMP